MRRRDQRGMVTVELAIGVLSAAIVTVLLAWVLGLVVTQARCADSAAQVARAVARGDAAAEQVARANAPEGATVEVTKQAGKVRVRVKASRSVLGLPGFQVMGLATLPMEKGQT